ncbi:MAG: tetratricopeptide repeat protein [Ignavibacteriaceae bacterium]
MQLYLNELAPWERKKEYFNTIELRNDVKKQNELLSKAAKQQVISQLSHTDKIIASQDRVSSYLENISFGMNNLSNQLDNVVDSIYDLKSTFEWGISEVVWQLEQNRKVLKDILEILMAPLDTQAKERKKRAIEAYSNDWIDDAEEEFIESEKLNKYDFSIHISLGMIYLFKKIDKNKSLNYFSKAIKYARPKSTYYTSYSLLYYSLIKFDIGEIKEAEESTQEVINLTPDFLEAYYQNAQYNSQLGNIEKAIKNLEYVIRKDKFYAIKVDTDKLFDPIRGAVLNLIIKLRDENYKTSQLLFDDVVSLITKINHTIFFHNDKKIMINVGINDFQQIVDEINFLLLNNTFFDSIDAIKYTLDFQNEVTRYFNSLKAKGMIYT